MLRYFPHPAPASSWDPLCSKSALDRGYPRKWLLSTLSFSDFHLSSPLVCVQNCPGWSQFHSAHVQESGPLQSKLWQHPGCSYRMEILPKRSLTSKQPTNPLLLKTDLETLQVIWKDASSQPSAPQILGSLLIQDRWQRSRVSHLPSTSWDFTNKAFICTDTI